MPTLPATSPKPRRIVTPLLRNGDRMTAAEFEARYAAMPDLKKAELLRGVVYMPSPVTLDQHGEPHSEIVGWLLYYRAMTPGLRSGDNTTLRLSDADQPQPDALLMIPRSAGGQAVVSEDGYVTGPPELACEIAYSSGSYDLGVKKDVYAEFGVKEYLVWQVENDAIEWFVLRNGRYVALDPGPDNVLRSETFPGLWLDWQALVTGDLARVFTVLQHGCAIPEHDVFVHRLAQAR
jgi:Uma2 family endonuclease